MTGATVVEIARSAPRPMIWRAGTEFAPSDELNGFHCPARAIRPSTAGAAP